MANEASQRIGDVIMRLDCVYVSILQEESKSNHNTSVIRAGAGKRYLKN